MPTVLVTGATRGLGLATVHALAGRAEVLAAGRRPGPGVDVLLDLASLESVASAEIPPVDVLVCNAGLQFRDGPPRLTEDGFEETVQVNFLAHLALVDRLRPARVVWLGSGTHDPAQRTGMPAPREDDVAAIARGEVEGGRRRYSTSKLLCTAVTGALARERPDAYVACFDPGLMMSTGLVRDYPAPLARLYTAMGGLAARFTSTASTPQRSAEQLARLALEDVVPSGTTMDHHGRPARISARAADPAFQDEVLRVGRELLRAA